MKEKSSEDYAQDAPRVFDFYVTAAMNVVSNIRIAQDNFSLPDEAFYEQVYEIAERMIFEREKRERSIGIRQQYEKEWTFERLDLLDKK